MKNTQNSTEVGGCPAASCSALAGTFDIEAIEQAFFNHDHNGSEPAPGQWEKRRDQWRSFKTYLAAHPRQEITGRDAYKEEMPNAERSQKQGALGSRQQRPDFWLPRLVSRRSPRAAAPRQQKHKRP